MKSAAGTSVIACGCGKHFLTEAALEQHRRDRANSTAASKRNNPCVKKTKGSPMPKSAAKNTPTLKNTSTGPVILSSKERWLAKGAGSLVDTLTSLSLKLSGSEASISSSDQYDLICSYNWANMRQPTVYVPGGAPVYEAVPLPTTVKPDSGRQFLDQNTARIPNYPFEVVFQAAEMMNPTVSFDKIDVLANRNSLRKFFEFCKGRAQDSFRVNLHLINDTLIIERCVKSAVQFLYGSGGSGFGHNFERAVTRYPPGLEDSSGHHRVLRYDFGGLNCAVGFEVDAAYDDPETAGVSEGHDSKMEAHGQELNSLATDISSMHVAKDKSSVGRTRGSADTIRRGAGTAQEGVAELKSRKVKAHAHRARPKAEWLPQLWFGRTRYLITGHHNHGIFNDVHARDLREELEAWEENNANQESLQKMSVLLSSLRNVVRKTEAKACVVICEKAVKPPTLRIYTSTSGKRALPDSVVKKFWSTGAH